MLVIRAGISPESITGDPTCITSICRIIGPPLEFPSSARASARSAGTPGDDDEIHPRQCRCSPPANPDSRSAGKSTDRGPLRLPAPPATLASCHLPSSIVQHLMYDVERPPQKRPEAREHDRPWPTVINYALRTLDKSTHWLILRHRLAISARVIIGLAFVCFDSEGIGESRDKAAPTRASAVASR